MNNFLSTLVTMLIGSLCSLATASPAHWEAVLLTDVGLYHFNPHSVKGQGQTKTFQTLLDYQSAQETVDGRQYFSSQAEVQLNCKSHSARIMHMTYYAGAKASGKEIRKEGSIRDWLEIPKGSPIERIAHRIC